jgi:hypothetical protein
MSLKAQAPAAMALDAVVLRSPAQFAAWKNYVAAACREATAKEVFEVSDEDCQQAINKLQDPNAVWVCHCWAS